MTETTVQADYESSKASELNLALELKIAQDRIAELTTLCRGLVAFIECSAMDDDARAMVDQAREILGS